MTRATVMFARCIQMWPSTKQNRFSVLARQPCPFLPAGNWPWASPFIVCISSTAWILCKTTLGLFPYSHKLCHTQAFASTTQASFTMWTTMTEYILYRTMFHIFTLQIISVLGYLMVHQILFTLLHHHPHMLKQKMQRIEAHAQQEHTSVLSGLMSA